MTGAEKAYQIAEERIERAKREGLRYLSLSSVGFTADGVDWNDEELLSHLATLPPTIADLTGLSRLDLDDTQVADTSNLAAMAAMRELHLFNTQVADISPLVAMTSMQTLRLDNTQIADISLLAAMTAMQRLFLKNKQLADLRQISDLASLIEDTKGLSLLARVQHFIDIPATHFDPDGLGRLSEIEDTEERTRETLAYLKSLTHWPPGEPTAPEPATDAIAFGPNDDGKVRITESALPADDPAQDALQQELLRAARELAAHLDGDNQFGALAQDASGFTALLSLPASQIAAKALWPLDVRLRNALTADQAADADGRLNEMLPPLARSALEGVVAIGAPWLQDHPGYQDLVEALMRLNWPRLRFQPV